MLRASGANRIVSELWERYSPAQIADYVNARDPTIHMTAKWVEGIKRRLDGNKGLVSKE